MNSIDQSVVSASCLSPSFAPGTPFLVDCCVVLQCVRGHASFVFNFREYEVAEGDFVFLFSDIVVMQQSRSDDFEVRYITLTEPHIQELLYGGYPSSFWERLELSPVQRFSGRLLEVATSWIDTCIFVAERCVAAVAEDVVAREVALMFAVIANIMESESYSSDEQYNNLAWKIVGDFYVLLARHYTTEHKVQFYADRLNITPDYLSVLTKRCTGMTPKEVIEGQLVLAVKAMLETTGLSVKAIAHRLHYDDSSHLCRVFRRNTGTSPLAHRRAHFKK